jgi:uncharacterized protein (UPF0548 family)
MFFITPPTDDVVRSFLATQKDLPFSYAEVGATKGELPVGYTHDHNRVRLGQGSDVYAQAVAALRQWRQFDLGWVSAVPRDTPLKIDATVAIRARTGPVWSLSASRIVYVIDDVEERTAFGFAYGTLPDHVECGEERFLVEWIKDDDSVWYDIMAFSRPRHPLVRLAAPYARRLQKRFARESLQVMAAAVTPKP